MRTLFLICTLAISLTALAQAPQKSKINTQLFEQEAGTSVSGKVKVIREIQEETEVFLDNTKGSSGPFVLPTNTKNRAGLIKILNKSQKTGGPSVTISVDDQQRIKNVEESQSTTPPGEQGH